MKRIGTDVSIAECRRSGYMVMEFPGELLDEKGKLNKDVGCTFSVSNPMAWSDFGRPDISKIQMGFEVWDLSPHDTEYSFNDLLEILKNEKNLKMISSNCDWKNCKPELDNPTEYDMLHLASDIHFTVGLYQ